MMNHSSSSAPQGQGYTPESEAYSSLDHQLLVVPTASNWQGLPAQYGQAATYAPQQTYQSQFSRPSIQQYAGYGVHQPSTYPIQSYPDAYGSQFPHSNQIEPYGVPQYDAAPSQASAGGQQSYIGGTDPFPFSNIAVEGPTVSPQALQRVDLSNVSHRSGNGGFIDQRQSTSGLDPDTVFHNDWNGRSVGGFGAQQVHTSQAYQQISDQEKQISYPSLNTSSVRSISHQGDGADSDGETSRNPISRKGKSRGYAVVVDQGLLGLLSRNPSRGMANAPYVFVDEKPVLLDIGVKTTGLKSKSRNSRTRNRPLSESKITLKKSRASKPATGENKVEMSKQMQAKASKKRPGPDVAVKITTESPRSFESDSSTDDESSSESDSGEESTETSHQETLNDVRGGTRPSDIPGAAAWDAIGIVWVPLGGRVSQEEVVQSAVKFVKLFSTLLEDLKVARADLTAAETGKRPDVEKLKNARDARREALYSAIRAVEIYSHRDILKNLGGSDRLVNGLATVLKSHVKAEDFNGKLPKAILRLMTNFTTLREQQLVKIKFEIVERWLSRKGDAEIKNYIATIRSNIQSAEPKTKVAEEDQKFEKTKVVKPTQGAVKPRKTEDSLRASSVPGIKRSYESDGVGSQLPNKKIASDTTALSQSQKTLDTTAVSQNQKAQTTTTKSRPPNYFDNLKRSTVRPGPTAKVPNPAPTIQKSEPKPPPRPAPKAEPSIIGQSPISAILASITNRSDGSARQPKVPVGPPETPEEKAKRERKESRRHLRVRWKEGDALVETRLFRHEQAEDEGRQEDMLRDAHDDRSEGMMHRQRVLQTMAKSADTLDDEDDVGEVEYRPYPELVPIDFSVIPSERLETNFVTRGGKVSFTTPQQRIQDQRESMELMVVYTDPKDIPPSAKEPPPYENTRASQVEPALGQPTALWLTQRLREIYLYGADNAMSLFLGKLGEQKSTSDITTILNSMKGTATQPANQQLYGNAQFISQASTTPYYQPSHQQLSQSLTPMSHQQPSQSQPPMSSTGNNNMANDNPYANLFRIVESLKGKPFPATEPPAWLNEHGRAMWLEGLNRDNAAKAAAEKKHEDTAIQIQPTKSLEAQMQPQTQPFQMQPQMQPPQMQPSHNMHNTQPSHMQPPQMQYSQMQHPQAQYQYTQSHYPQLPYSQLQYAQPQYSQMQSQATAQLPTTTANATPSFDPKQIQDILTRLTQGVGSNNNDGQGYATQNQQPQPQPHWDAGYASTTTTTESNHSAYNTANQDNGQKRWDGYGSGVTERHRGASSNDYKRGTKPCKFWQEGKCAKGDNCTFRHD